MTTTDKREFHVEFERCLDGVFITKSTDIPGLVLETESFQELMESLCILGPELLESNLHISAEELESVLIHVSIIQEESVSKGPRILLDSKQECLIAA